MPEKFQNRYRIPPARLQNWDYGWSATYFITICTRDRQHYFGEILNEEMQLSEIGKIAESEWLKTPEIRPDMNLELDAFVVMPNHFHGIIIIGENRFNDAKEVPGGDAMHRRDAIYRRDAMHRVSTGPGETTEAFKNRFGPQSKNLASVLRGFKSAVTNKARKAHGDFAWQPRFHDHIIRNHKSYQTISEYIFNNPKNWLSDKFYSVD